MSAFSLNNKLAILFLSFVLFITYTPQSFAQKGNKKDLETKKKKLKEEINTINDLLHETKSSKKLSMNQVAILNKKISVREELIQTINYEIHLINKQINENQTAIKNLNATLDKLKKDYAAMIYFDYRNSDAYSKLMFLFAADSFNQAYQQYKYTQQIAEYRRKKAAEITDTQNEITKKNTELNSKKEEKKQLLGSEELEKLNLAKEKDDQENTLSSLQQTEKQLKGELDKKKSEIENLNAAIKKLIQEEIKRQQDEERKHALALAKKKEERANKAKEKKTKPSAKKTEEEKKADAKEAAAEMAETKEAEQLSSDFSANKGKLPWPVAKGVITIGFGEQEHPTIKGFMINNNGVEISAAKGQNARAVFEGIVTGVTTVPGIGKIVIIRHGDYLSVYSNLEEVLVKSGDKIALKQNIGTIAFNDDENRNVINFQIWKGQKILNPEEWLYK
ncbi:MAG TPA: peptidoglycan DD-metalloendopeptidase family protein [Bacteroidia bacterium]|nr:peptidoglycan DD-metalloendopeptidase family protein [Bacteroidia bacterium]